MKLLDMQPLSSFRSRFLLAAGCLSLFSSSVGIPGILSAHPEEGQENFEPITELIAVLNPTNGQKAHGIVVFQKKKDQVEVTAHIEGLQPNSLHGFHIHEYGDLTGTDGMSAGTHYNPTHELHGLPDQAHHQAGDLGNVQANAQGIADLHLITHSISLADDEESPILGRAVILHEKADDGSQPAGNAGARIAAGVIGVKNPNTPLPLPPRSAAATATLSPGLPSTPSISSPQASPSVSGH